ncbi:MAG: hypothetical protein R3F46_00890 [bacterium]
MTGSRRDFIRKLSLAALAIPLLGGSAAAQSVIKEETMTPEKFVSKGSAAIGGNFAVDPDWEAANQELISGFVGPCHFSLEQVREQLAREPRLVNARNRSTDEAGIEAASHVANRGIAEFLLGSGAPYTVHCAVMLGQLEGLRGFLMRDPGLAARPGAHGIPMMFHAAISGSVDIAELLVEHGGGQDYDWALGGATGWHQPEMTVWLLEQGADPNFVSRGKTALDWSMQRGEHPGIIAILRQHGGRSAEELGISGEASQ